jgi:Glyoxalase-like domain
MFIGIDHLVIAVTDPDDAAARLERDIGLSASGGGRHDTLGTFNRIVWFGDSYLELIGVFDPVLAERSWVGRPALTALEVGGGLATWAIATDDLDADLALLRARGSGLGDAIPGERRRADGAVVRWRLAAAPALGPAEPPFLIEHDTSAAEWTVSDQAERAAMAHGLGGRVTLETLELAVDDVNLASQRLLRTVGLRFRPSLAGGGARDANIGDQVVRLRPRRGGPGVPVIRLRASAAAERSVDLFGCRWMVASEP